MISLMCIKNSIDYLTDLGLPFVMTWQDHLLWDLAHHTTAATYQLQKKIKPHMWDFEGLNHSEWAVTQGHAVTAQGHLGPLAHKAVADHLERRINNYYYKGARACNLQKTSA